MTHEYNAPSLELAGAFSDRSAAHDAARRIGGNVYEDQRDDPSKLPFAALVTGVTDDPTILAESADVGMYLVCRRVIKPGAAQVYGLFPMLHHPQKTHEQADAHWRDVHGPLALEHHAFMSHYVQLSVVHTLAGAAFDGFALCGFESISDLKERFFTTEESVAVIAADIQNFADAPRSPRRLIATPTNYAA
jgi:uncharacterized protein (TIGR02118 family)